MKSKDEILKEIERLEIENADLRKKIRKIDDYELFQTVRKNNEIAMKYFYDILPFEFINTVFYTHKTELTKLMTGCFLETVLDHACVHNAYRQKELILHIPVYCKDIMQSNGKFTMILQDPYKTVKTQPITNFNEKEAAKCKGSMLLAKIVIPKNYRACEFLELKEYKILNMNLTSIKGYHYPEILTHITQFSMVHNELEAKKALDFLEEYYKTTSIRTKRYNDLYLFLLLPRKKLGFKFVKNQLWYMEETYDAEFAKNFSFLFTNTYQANHEYDYDNDCRFLGKDFFNL